MILHKVKAYLYDNVLTKNPNDFVARVSSERSLNVKDVCRLAVTRGGADTTMATMEHNVKLWFKEMGYQLNDGYSINADGWFVAGLHIKGVFNSPTETFNPQKHNAFFHFRQGTQLRKGLDNIEIDVLGIADSLLSIMQVVDIKTGSVNNLLTPNRNLRISGAKIKIAGSNAENGVYFVNQTTHARAKVEFSDIIINNPSELMIVVPELAAGTYQIEIITQFSGNSIKQLQEPHSTIFDKVLTVQ